MRFRWKLLGVEKATLQQLDAQHDNLEARNWPLQGRVHRFKSV
jgi:hypothetical protein